MSASDLINLASEKLGARAIATNDDFFASKDNLVKDAEPVANDEYTDRGKWMDGWESRRRREPGYDWCVVKLGARGIIDEIVVDTTHFKGNHPPECSIEACDAPGSDDPGSNAGWLELLPKSPLSADAKNSFTITSGAPATHLRLNIFPDGGVARLRALGRVVVDVERLRSMPEVNLAAAENGAVVVLASDMFFGHRQNLIMPGRAESMRDGWETRRRRGPGNDWAVVKLAAPGTIHRVEIDTSWFKGNAPGSCSIDVIHAPDVSAEQLESLGGWTTLLPPTPTKPHTNHVFEKELSRAGEATHARLNIFPDGGVSRLLLWGTAAGTPG